MNEPATYCPSCEKVAGAKHKLDCPNITLADALWHAKYLKIGEAYYHRVYQQQLAAAQRWEGKFRVVKHENNQLRRKLTNPATPSFTDEERRLCDFASAEMRKATDLHQTTP